MEKAKKPRVDKRKNVGKVAEIIAKNPNKTQREIAKEAGVSNGTAHNATKELEQTGAKDPTIAYIVGSAKARLKKVNRIFDQIIQDAEDHMFDPLGNRRTEIRKIGEVEMEVPTNIGIKEKILIKDLAKDDMARVTILGGDATDEDGTLKTIQEISITIGS